jgi:IS30 family transposase
MEYKHLSASERDNIALYLMSGKLLNRHHTTIMREYKRYFVHSGERYYAFGAHIRAVIRKRKSVQRERLKSEKTRRYVENKLRLGWSPEIIAGRLKQVEVIPSVSYEAVYQYVYAQAKHLIGYLPRRHPKRYTKGYVRKAKRSKIPNRISITQRSEAINERQELGHWESDTMVSRESKTALNVLVELVSRLTRITSMNRASAEQTHKAIVKQLGKLDSRLRQSITYDNGSENTSHEQTNTRLNSESYFCEPYHSWEKGTVEQTNGLIRRYLPKKTNFADITRTDIKRIENLLNNRPRKCLNYQTPLEVFQNHSGALPA